MSEQELRLIDANLNRLREGIRVVEDIFRYAYNDKNTAKRLKELRHQSRINLYNELLDARDIKNDVLKKTTSSEQKRENLKSILIANFKRAQESARVLEELTKLLTTNKSEVFKAIRYELYDLEKEMNHITF
ncbi:MAG: thiamine-phosphate pyrophosphorylase [Campylobacteraceae bacterium]|nr:thiamine-phosphate pyrophosphorylase [Campylobacteraceae bacterium]